MTPTNMAIAPSATIKHKEAFKKCPDFPGSAPVKVLSTHNPWRPGSHGWPFFEHILRPKPLTTIEGILNDAYAIGFYRTDSMRLIRWLFTWGDFLEIDGQRYFPEMDIVGIENPRRSKKSVAKSA